MAQSRKVLAMGYDSHEPSLQRRYTILGDGSCSWSFLSPKSEEQDRNREFLATFRFKKRSKNRCYRSHILDLSDLSHLSHLSPALAPLAQPVAKVAPLARWRRRTNKVINVIVGMLSSKQIGGSDLTETVKPGQLSRHHRTIGIMEPQILEYQSHFDQWNSVNSVNCRTSSQSGIF